MTKVVLESGSSATGSVAIGCEHCINGSKMVLFITGKCKSGCFYCPISSERANKDVVYANEMKAENMDDIMAEAEAMDATGTGITGGDPLIDIERTVRAVSALKNHFGSTHHIHLYTSTFDVDKCLKLQEVGLDEIRFHPAANTWSDPNDIGLKEIVDATEMDVGIEVPALPNKENDLKKLIAYSLDIGIDFINLNELEFSETNWSMMEKNGYELKDDLSAAVLDSETVAKNLMKAFPDAPIHFCSSTFKDSVQLRKRLIRRAENTAKEYDIVTDDGTVLKGLIYADDLDAAVSLLSEEYDVPDSLMFLDKEHNRLEIASWIVEEIHQELPFKCYIIEEYPTTDRLEVERIPLDKNYLR